MGLGMRIEGAERIQRRGAQFRMSFIPKMMIERELIKDSTDEAVVIIRRTIAERIGHLRNMGETRFEPKENTNTLWKSIRATEVRLGQGKVIVDRGLFEGYFYAKVFELGMAKFPNYYGRHFWRDSHFMVQRMYRRLGKVVMRRIQGHYREGAF